MKNLIIALLFNFNLLFCASHSISGDFNKYILSIVLKREMLTYEMKLREYSPLAYAAQNNDVEGVKKIVERSSIGNEDLNTSFVLAVDKGHTEIAKLLIEKGANPNFHVVDGNNSLMWALYKQNNEVVELLRKHPNLNINARNNNGDTALHLAALHADYDTIEFLLNNRNADPNITNIYGWTVLMSILVCSFHPNLKEQIKFLIKHGANPNIVDVCGSTPLIWACTNRLHLEIIKAFLVGGADVNIENSKKQTVLDIEKDEIVLNLLKFCSLDFVDAMMFALKSDNDELIQLTLQRAANIDENLVIPLINTGLIFAAKSGKIESLELLKQSINSKNKLGQNTLIWAAKNKRKDLVDMILNLKNIYVKVNEKDSLGNTALNCAERNEWQDVFELLKKRGAFLE